MQADIAARLVTLNRQFYQTFAPQFSATRLRLQPGVRKVLEKLPLSACVLDLGCGNGELARQLMSRGHQGAYVGLDYSPALVEIARQSLPAGSGAVFLQADLTTPGWETLAARPTEMGRSFRPEYALAFAVLHHIPGAQLRCQVLSALRSVLAPDGVFIHSEWQFLKSPRLRARLQPWERVGLRASQVDPGDYLLDWRAGGAGLRYVHHFSEAELADLAQDSGYSIQDSFLSDGQDGDLGLYQVWRPAS